MDIDFSEEHKMFRKAIREFTEKEIAPLVDEAEATQEFPLQLFPRMGQLGYICVSAPAEYGGADMDMVGECIFAEELSRVSPGIGMSLMNHSGISILCILAYGTEEQKLKYLVPALKGEKIGAIGISEPDAGSDVAGIKTTAVRKGDKYVINGSKTYITNGPICDFVTLAVYTDKSLGTRGGMSLIIVEKNAPGFTWTKMDKFCVRSSPTAELFFDDCKVPVDNLIGEEGRGFYYIMEDLDRGRVSHAASSVGLAQAAFDYALDYAQKREQFGQPIYKFQANSFKLARMATDIEAARWLTYRAAGLYDQGERRLKEASMSKLFASEVCERVTAEAMQLHGGIAIMNDSPVQRYFRDARVKTVGEGTSEIQQIVIARALGLR
jgi:alkylation response protein AidB-like acyl-CoA dehydrogenase